MAFSPSIPAVLDHADSGSPLRSQGCAYQSSCLNRKLSNWRNLRPSAPWARSMRMQPAVLRGRARSLRDKRAPRGSSRATRATPAARGDPAMFIGKKSVRLPEPRHCDQVLLPSDPDASMEGAFPSATSRSGTVLPHPHRVFGAEYVKSKRTLGCSGRTRREV
jgi:hypothetical protein